jgi:hypothetical protein
MKMNNGAYWSYVGASIGCWWLLLLFPVALCAQVRDLVCKGGVVPMAQMSCPYYMDTTNRQCYFLHPLTRSRIGYSCLDLIAWNQWAIETRKEGFAVGTKEAILFVDFQEVIMEDSILLLVDSMYVVVLGTTDTVLSDFRRNTDKRADVEIPDTVLGIKAYSLPPNISIMNYQENQLRNWGMLGVNGHWLIEPKFDQPFRFQNGFAEVIYYGQRRKINEKGEFVE